MAACCSALADELAFLSLSDSCTCSMSSDYDSLQFVMDGSGEGNGEKDRRGTRSTGGYKRCTWLTGPKRRPSSRAVTLHLFESQKILSHTHVHTRRWKNG